MLILWKNSVEENNVGLKKYNVLDFIEFSLLVWMHVVLLLKFDGIPICNEISLFNLEHHEIPVLQFHFTKYSQYSCT